jgi:hypothetical protein
MSAKESRRRPREGEIGSPLLTQVQTPNRLPLSAFPFPAQVPELGAGVYVSRDFRTNCERHRRRRS